MTETPNLKLKKLGDNSIFSVEEIDKNMDIIDEEVEKVKTGKEPTIIKKTGFNLDKTDSTETDSSILLATAKAVKKVWDKAKEAIGFSDTNKAAILNNQEQIENLSISEIKNTWRYTPSSGEGYIEFSKIKEVGGMIFVNCHGLKGWLNSNKQGVVPLEFRPSTFYINVPLSYSNGAALNFLRVTSTGDLEYQGSDANHTYGSTLYKI